MIRTCSGDDPNLVGADGRACRCGRTFDDVEREVIYPHAAIWTREAKAALLERLGAANIRVFHSEQRFTTDAEAMDIARGVAAEFGQELPEQVDRPVSSPPS